MVAELPWILGGVLALLLRTQIPPSEHRLVRVVREVLLSAPLILVYFISRGLAPERPEIADRHARHLIGLERAAGVFWEPAIQHWVGRSTLATDVFNVVYTFGHWPVII